MATLVCAARLRMSTGKWVAACGRLARQSARYTGAAHEYADGVLRQDRRVLAQAITLVESTLPEHRADANRLLGEVLTALRTRSVEYPPNSDNVLRGDALRIGLSGPPGVGKSSFIEVFGMMLVERGFRVAVLAIDPSSTKSRGSILGDKTRMTLLSRHPHAFVRPSPSSGSLGGIARSTGEAALLCEAAGFNVILVETVGVGQSETAVAAMVDMFALLVAPAAGDELQGIKRGIVEVADLVIVNKADGDLRAAARAAQIEYTSGLKFLQPSRPFWKPQVVSCSSRENQGIAQIWERMLAFYCAATKPEGGETPLAAQRRSQRVAQMWHHINDSFAKRLAQERGTESIGNVERRVASQQLTSWEGADAVLASLWR